MDKSQEIGAAQSTESSARRGRRRMHPVSLKLPESAMELIYHLLTERPREYDGVSDVCRRLVLSHPLYMQWLAGASARERKDALRKATI